MKWCIDTPKKKARWGVNGTAIRMTVQDKNKWLVELWGHIKAPGEDPVLRKAWLEVDGRSSDEALENFQRALEAGYVVEQEIDRLPEEL